MSCEGRQDLKIVYDFKDFQSINDKKKSYCFEGRTMVVSSKRLLTFFSTYNTSTPGVNRNFLSL